MDEKNPQQPPLKDLIDIEQARAAIVGACDVVAGVECVALKQARGRILASPLISPRPLPVFDHSAMDGYALHVAPGGVYELVSRASAGHAPGGALASGEAMRISTGAPIPPGADAVVMHERAVVHGQRLTPRSSLRAGDNIRHAGEDVDKDECLVREGVVLDARHIGLAAAVGLEQLVVRRLLRVAMISTGDMLVEPGVPLHSRQIFDCNRPMLAAALDRPCLTMEDFGILPDRQSELESFFHDQAPRFDLIVATGGASVGDEDPLLAALAAAGGEPRVARVAMRPGKPFTYARMSRCTVAVLPGNPFAALVAALLFVRPLVERAVGLPLARFAPLPARACFASARALHRTEFAPARLAGLHEGLPVIERLGRGGSARLKPLIEADGLAVVDPGPEPIKPGDRIGFLPFGTAFSL